MSTNLRRSKKISRARIGEGVFYFSIVGVPFFLFLLLTVFPGYFYIFIFAIQKYDPYSASYVFQSDILYNFRAFIAEIASNPNWQQATLNSFIVYGLSWLLMPMQLFTAFYISKKMPGTKFYKVILMLPGMLPGMIWVLLYKNFAEFALVDLLNLPYGPLSNVDQQFGALLIYVVWMAWGGGMLLYSGVLSGVSPELIDAGRSDGLNLLGEFWYIALPQLYPVWIVDVIAGVAGFFSASPGTFEFFGLNAGPNVSTLGFLMFSRVMNGGPKNYGFDAAASICFSLIVMPITLFVKWVLERYGPSEDTREPIHWFWQRRRNR